MISSITLPATIIYVHTTISVHTRPDTYITHLCLLMRLGGYVRVFSLVNLTIKTVITKCLELVKPYAAFNSP